MELKIQFRGNVYSICIGYKTEWFESMSFVTITQEWYEHKQVVWADLIWRS